MMMLPTNWFRTLPSATAALLVSMLAFNPASSSADDHGLLADFDLSKVVGTEEAKCKQCHPSEVAQWEKTTHAKSLQRLKYEGNSKKYADALGISADALMGDSICAKCHGTTAKRDGAVKVISGVSCESCHGPAQDWLKPHGEYFDGMTFKDLAGLRSDREKETADHREQREKAVAEAGMIRPQDLHSLARNCLDCHLVDNEKLVAAGHKAASSFELVSWTGGEVRHNFFMDKDDNAAAPSLWMKTTGGTAKERDRVKFTVGTLTQIEMALRRRADATHPAYIPQIGGIFAAANGRLAQIAAVAPSPETGQAMGLVAPMLGTLFVGQPNDKMTYGPAAETVGDLAGKVSDSADGKSMSGLDALVGAVPPHYSQQYLQNQK